MHKFINTDVPDLKIKSPGMIVNVNSGDFNAYLKRKQIVQSNTDKSSLESRINNLEEKIDSLTRLLEKLVEKNND